MDGLTWPGDADGKQGRRGVARRTGEGVQRAAGILRAIEAEIIPRLLLVHRAAAETETESPTVEVVSERDVARLTELLLLDDETPAIGFVEAARARPLAVPVLFLDLLAPAARRLGDLWVQDRCDFTDVTIGLGRLQWILRALSLEQTAIGEQPAAERILLLPAPGEQHTFGLIMVGQFFRADGWDVVGGAWSNGGEAPAIVGSEWYDAVGFSLAAEIHLTALRQVIAEVRRSSVNPQVLVMVGGPIFIERPECARLVGADVTARDGSGAPGSARQWLSRRRLARSRVDVTGPAS